jgi:DNA-binding transcriptional LysR family regulator
MLDVRRLRLLSELARRGTIAEVAAVRGYSASAVSQALAQLEREAGVALLERDGRRVRLTDAAQRLVARTDRVLAELDVAEAELAAERDVVRGELTLGAFPSVAAAIVSRAVTALQRDHPRLRCAIREHEPEDGIPLLRSGDLDLVISESYDDAPAAPVGGLEQHVLLTEPLLAVLPAGHAAAEPVGLARLRDARWIGGVAGTQFAGVLPRACRAAGFEPDIVHRADDAELHRALVAAGLGIGLLPALACTPDPGVRYARLAAAPRRHVTMLTRRSAGGRPALRAAVEALNSAAGDLRAAGTASARAACAGG